MCVSIEKQKRAVRKAINNMSRAVSPEQMSLGRRAKKRSLELMKQMDEIIKEASNGFKGHDVKDRTQSA